MNDIAKISVPSYGGTGSAKDGLHVDVRGLTSDEMERLRASMLGGHHWVRRGDDGRLQHVPSYEELPGPVTDDQMLPFWRQPTDGETRQADMFGFDESTEAALKHASPSIYITSLCGYHYSDENYKCEAAKLTEWGFVCMRSPRDSDSGRYWEVWYLSGVWAVKGRLGEALTDSNAKTNDEKFKFVLEFLRRNASFGSLDVSMQRMAMVMD
ncbi:hypothetical protein KC865_03640 [Candidatus Kaiserbacteria bacterium]|nr:hypothetical protein [Candidatus Kaiserbacteria bacterium]USN91949.1 MAG: hypothetical protein H6782_03680 [Candidatus Nomurabacteria bacterium]